MAINLQGVSCHKLKVIDKPPSSKLLKEATQLCFIHVRELFAISLEQQLKSKHEPDKQWPQLEN